jgi:CCR4-NOT transcription complex subunit 1
MDALSKIFILLLKNYGDPNGAEVDESKIRYLNKILSIVVLVLVRSHEELGAEFDQRPFFRFFSSILNDLHSIEPSIRTAYAGCLRAFSSNTLSMLQPTLLPGFTFSWMSLVSHRLFMPKLLASSKDKVRPTFASLPPLKPDH